MGYLEKRDIMWKVYNKFFRKLELKIVMILYVYGSLVDY